MKFHVGFPWGRKTLGRLSGHKFECWGAILLIVLPCSLLVFGCDMSLTPITRDGMPLHPLPQPDTATSDTHSTHTEVVDACQDGIGCFGNRCAHASDCQSLCIPHLGSYVCTKPCSGATRLYS